MDFNYPVQETANGEYFVTLHSFTILDLDGLIDLNIHGNISGLARNNTVPGQVGTVMLNGLVSPVEPGTRTERNQSILGSADVRTPARNSPTGMVRTRESSATGQHGTELAADRPY
ncbi:MAG: hypothetical protein R3C19_19070 [Planctomycetaceae bacterium]